MRLLLEAGLAGHITRHLLNQTIPTPDPNNSADPPGIRRPISFPGHFYLISFLLLVLLISVLLACHCFRICRVANRIRATAVAHPELLDVLAGAGATSQRKTPQSVIDSLPVAKYGAVHAQWVLTHQSSEHVAKPAAAAAGLGRQQSEPLQQPHDSRQQLQRRSWHPWMWRQRGSSQPTAAAAASSSAPEAAGPSTVVMAAPQLTDDMVSVSMPHLPPPATSAVHARSLSADELLLLVRQRQQELEHQQQQASGSYPPHTLDPQAPAAGAAAQGLARYSVNTSSSSDALPCTICLEDFTDADDVKQLPCGHFFHVGCINQWLQRDITCPLCKHTLVPEEDLLQRNALVEAVLQDLRQLRGSTVLSDREVMLLIQDVAGRQQAAPQGRDRLAASRDALFPHQEQPAQQQQQRGTAEAAAPQASSSRAAAGQTAAAGDVEMPARRDAAN